MYVILYSNEENQVKISATAIWLFKSHCGFPDANRRSVKLKT